MDELVPLEKVVDRAVEWCQGLLKLPERAMATTRQRARADLSALFQDIDREIDDVVSAWWSDEAQRVLGALAAKLTKKTPG